MNVHNGTYSSMAPEPASQKGLTLKTETASVSLTKAGSWFKVCGLQRKMDLVSSFPCAQHRSGLLCLFSPLYTEQSILFLFLLLLYVFLCFATVSDLAAGPQARFGRYGHGGGRVGEADVSSCCQTGAEAHQMVWLTRVLSVALNAPVDTTMLKFVLGFSFKHSEIKAVVRFFFVCFSELDSLKQMWVLGGALGQELVSSWLKELILLSSLLLLLLSFLLLVCIIFIQ